VDYCVNFDNRKNTFQTLSRFEYLNFRKINWKHTLKISRFVIIPPAKLLREKREQTIVAVKIANPIIQKYNLVSNQTKYCTKNNNAVGLQYSLRSRTQTSHVYQKSKSTYDVQMTMF
jgi:hypothetical protein